MVSIVTAECLTIRRDDGPSHGKGAQELTQIELVQKEFIYERLPGYPSAHGSSVARRENGELIAAWFGGSHENHPDTVVLFARKPAGVAEWQDVRPVQGMNDPKPYGNAALFVEPCAESKLGERIWLFFIRSEGRHGRGWCLDCMTYVTTSLDGGWTWSEPRLLKHQWSFLIKNKPLRLATTGELAIPAYSDRENNSVLCIYNDREDRWSFSDPVPMPEGVGVIQPALVEYPDQTLQMFFRTHAGRIWTSRSKDAGRTWSRAEPTELPNPDAGIDAVALPDGRLVLVYNPTTRGRTPLWLRVSDDRGVTWTDPLVLEDGEGEYSYPAVIATGEDTLHLTYTYRRTHIVHAEVKVF